LLSARKGLITFGFSIPPCYNPIMFSVDTKGLEGYADELRGAAKRLQWATAYYLTELAWKTRDEAQREVEKTIEVRDKRFVQRHLVVNKALGRQPIDQQIARAGSYEGPRFSGWREQQEGGEKERIASHKARTGGSRKGRMVGRVRLKPGNRFRTPNEVVGAKNAAHQVFIFLRMMSRAPKAPFVLDSGHPSFPAGVWTLDGRHGQGKWPKPRLLQRFGADVKVKKNPWMTNARETIVKRTNIPALWVRMWDKAGVIKKKKYS